MLTTKRWQEQSKFFEDVATLQTQVDLEDPVSLLDQVNLECTQRAAQVNNTIVIETQRLLAKLISIIPNSQRYHS